MIYEESANEFRGNDMLGGGIDIPAETQRQLHLTSSPRLWLELEHLW